MKKSGITFSPVGAEASTSRRNFLRFTGAGIITTGLLLAGCDDDVDVPVLGLAKPSDLTVTQLDEGSLLLNWADTTYGEDGFIIERSTDPNSGFAKIGEVEANVTTFTDPVANLEKGTTYYYRVRAFRGTEMSEYTAVASSVGGTILIDLGSGDLGVLNYAYALEQLEAAFYTQVLAGAYYAGASDVEKRILEDLQQHEVAHREFFKAAISAVGEPIPTLEANFSSVDFGSRDSVLATAKVFENLGVAAYNGAGQLIENPTYLLIAGKIVSVEARHASVINNLINPGSTEFASTADVNGLDPALLPAAVLTAVAPFLITRLSAANLPTS